ncbi:MAG TPA: winged helix-turn-helix transcriptional regulator [Thermoanaerobaculia bacterium]|nr:winged helix-turn-helix transcriptional regulator [Thermoanaerobaculia bacterium]
MRTKRSYEDGCATAHALDLIGERWGLLVVRELILGPKRFTDLRAGLPGISPNVLTERLEELERTAIVRRRKLPPPAAAWVYELTEWGLELENVIKALGRWAARSPFLPQAGMNADSVILSFRTMFDPRSAAGFDATIELRIADDRFHARVSRGRIELTRGGADHPDTTLEGDTDTFLAVAYGGRSLADAVRAGDFKVDGDKAAARRFFTLFPLPERAPADVVTEAGRLRAR